MNTVLLAGAIFAALETRAIAAIAAGVAISCGALGCSFAMGKAASHAIDAGARQCSLHPSSSSSLFVSTHSLLHSS